MSDTELSLSHHSIIRLDLCLGSWLLGRREKAEKFVEIVEKTLTMAAEQAALQRVSGKIAIDR